MCIRDSSLSPLSLSACVCLCECVCMRECVFACEANCIGLGEWGLKWWVNRTEKRKEKTSYIPVSTHSQGIKIMIPGYCCHQRLSTAPCTIFLGGSCSCHGSIGYDRDQPLVTAHLVRTLQCAWRQGLGQALPTQSQRGTTNAPQCLATQHEQKWVGCFLCCNLQNQSQSLFFRLPK